jgi:hypothetical protein
MGYLRVWLLRFMPTCMKCRRLLVCSSRCSAFGADVFFGCLKMAIIIPRPGVMNAPPRTRLPAEGTLQMIKFPGRTSVPLSQVYHRMRAKPRRQYNIRLLRRLPDSKAGSLYRYRDSHKNPAGSRRYRWLTRYYCLMSADETLTPHQNNTPPLPATG